MEIEVGLVDKREEVNAGGGGGARESSRGE